MAKRVREGGKDRKQERTKRSQEKRSLRERSRKKLRAEEDNLVRRRRKLNPNNQGRRHQKEW